MRTFISRARIRIRIWKLRREIDRTKGQLKAQKLWQAMYLFWLLYGAVYVTRDEMGNVVVWDPSTFTVIPNRTGKGQ